MPGCLDGIRVLELARFQAGPRGGMLLSDLGAEVLKIEPPGGEETRKHPPLVRGQSVYFSVYNRGKKSVCLDLRHAQGKEIFAALVAKADIVLENFRPGVMRAMGFDYERLAALNRGIILVSISGFGQYGPYRERPAFDSLGQAMSGLMSLTGQLEGKPIGTASSVVDRYTALHATIGTLAALRHRERTGEGQVVDVCLLDSALTMVRSQPRTISPPGRKAVRAAGPRTRRKMASWSSPRRAGRWPDASCKSPAAPAPKATPHPWRAARVPMGVARSSSNGAPSERRTKSARSYRRRGSPRRPCAPSRRSLRIRISGSARCWSRWRTLWPARCTCPARRSSSPGHRRASGRCPPSVSTPTRRLEPSWATTAPSSPLSAPPAPSPDVLANRFARRGIEEPPSAP